MAYEIVSVCCGGKVVIKTTVAPNSSDNIGMAYYECCSCGQSCHIRQQETDK